VSEALDVALLGKPEAQTKRNAETYELVLQANHFMAQHTGESLERAIELYREALDKAPDDAHAWAGLGLAKASQAGYGFTDTRDAYREARRAVERALEIDSALPEAHETLGWILSSFEYRWDEAGQAFRKAIELAPSGGRMTASMATFEAIQGRIDRALSLSARAVELDPLSASILLLRGRVQIVARRYDDALDTFAKAIDLSPGMTTAHANRGILHALQGHPEDGVTEAQREASTGYRCYALAIVNHALGDSQASDEALAALIAEGEEWSFQVAVAHSFRNEVDLAFEALERAYFSRDSGLAIVRVFPLFDNLHGDPRWPRFLERVGLKA